MEFRVLGPIEASEGSGSIPLGGPKQRAVLAHLLIRANRVVPSDDLIDAVWGEEPPDLPRASVHTYISNLRRVLGERRIMSRSPGYLLRIETDELDGLRFESLVRQGRRLLVTDPERATSLLAEALGMWRGRPFADLLDDPALGAETTRLDELRLTALEDKIDAGLALGRHSDQVAELEALVREYPLRERFWKQLMMALYRSGRQGEALSAYVRARTLIVDELGVEPSAELRQLHARMARQDPTLELTGRPLRGYRLIEQVGAGSFGTVFRALQPDVGREVAVKVVHDRLASDPEFIHRFEKEAQLVARLEHPHIVPLYDYWRDPGGAYLVMRYVRGGNLKQVLERRGALGADAAARLVDQLASALAAAHRQGVIHRDVRPPNVLFDEEGNAYLSDFGIAKELAAAKPSPGSSSDLIYYLSPEEIRGDPITPATDIYNLGLVLYEVLAGRHPFADTPASEVLGRHLGGTLPRLTASRQDLPAQVDEVISRATALDAGARYPDAPALAFAIRSALEAAPEATVALRIQVPNPYKGLRPFREADASDFFGRDALITRLVSRLADGSDGARFLAVVGPSGSGKSSVVSAGLVPSLRAGALPGLERWFVAEMHPGDSPFEELEGALLRVAARPPTDLLQLLESGQDGLLRASRQVLPEDGSELLLVVDQFEELFTLTQDEDCRSGFLKVLAVAVADPLSRVRIVVSLRADFYDRPLLYRAFGDLLAARTEAVPPLSTNELVRAIVGPADRVGVRMKPGLVSEIVTEVADQPGALPLLQYALTELFERRDTSELTIQAYREIGGTLGALGRRAEEIYGSLDAEGKETARQLFLRLVTVGDQGTAETRRRVRRGELMSLELDPSALERIIDLFGAHRMLSFDRDPVTRGATVEVAHEALLRDWARLRGWIESAREDVRVHRRLAMGATEWVDGHRDGSFLLRGARLVQVETWASTTGLALTSIERAYLKTSTARRDAERAEETARKAREEALERRSLVRLRALVALFAIAAIVASGLTFVALNQRGNALREARLATARELAAAAVANLDVDPERSILLALEAVRTTRSVDGSVLPEAEQILHRSITASRIVATVPGAGRRTDWSPGGLLAFAGVAEEGRVELRTAKTGTLVRGWTAHIIVKDLKFSADGSVLATSGGDGAIKLWNPSTGALMQTFAGPYGDVWGLSFSADGKLVAGLWWDAEAKRSTARIWELSTEREVRIIDGLEGPTQLAATDAALSPDGRWIAVAISSQPLARIYEIGTGRLLHNLAGGQVFQINDISWSPDGTRLATVGQDLAVRIWDPASGTLIRSLYGHTAAVVAAAWSPDASRLVTAGVDGIARLWEIVPDRGRLVLNLAGHGVALKAVAFSPDGSRILTADEIGTAKIWDVGLSGDAEWMNLPIDGSWFDGVAYTPDGKRVLGSVPGGKVTMWDSQTGQEILTFAGHDAVPGFAAVPAVATIAVSPDGQLVATGGRDSLVRVWRAATGELLYTFRGHAGARSGWLEGVQFSPDGRLLATASQDGTSRILVASSGRELRSLHHGGPVLSIQFSPDGHSLITGSADGLVRVWNPADGSEIRAIRVGSEVHAVAVDSGGNRLAAATKASTASVWDLRTGKRIATYLGHSSPLWGVAFSPDGSRVATASEDGEIRLWNPDSGVTTIVLPGHSAPVRTLAFSPDGSRLASIGGDGKLRVWAININDLIRIAEQELTRSLTDAECRQYLHVAPCPAGMLQ